MESGRGRRKGGRGGSGGRGGRGGSGGRGGKGGSGMDWALRGTFICQKVLTLLKTANKLHAQFCIRERARVIKAAVNLLSTRGPE